jgi:plastocyanin
MRRKPVLALVLAAAVVAGCGDDTEYEPVVTEPDKGSPGAAEPSGGKVDIAIRDARFTPSTMRLREGQIIVWTNEDREGHTVVARGGDGPRSRVIRPGGRFEHTVLDPGRIAYACTIHPRMRGTLVVGRRV